MHRIHKLTFTGRLLRERDKFELLLNRVGHARRMTTKGASGGHSVKDILAHILSQEQYIADRLALLLQGEEYTPSRTQAALDAFQAEYGYPDFGSPLLGEGAPMAWVVERYRGIPLDEVVAHELEAFAGLLALLERIPEDMLNGRNLFERVADHSYKLYREHAADIRRWLRTLAVNSKPR